MKSIALSEQQHSQGKTSKKTFELTHLVLFLFHRDAGCDSASSDDNYLREEKVYESPKLN